MLFWKKRKLNKLLKKVALLSEIRSTNNVADAVLKREIEMYKKIAVIYLSLVGSRDFKFAKESAYECYRLTAKLGDVESMRVLGEYRLDEGKFWSGYDGTYLNDPEIHPKYAKRCFEEAVSLLKTASNLEDAPSRRLFGLMHVNGWGMEVDIDEGLKLIVNSLDLENSWNDSSRIFAELGLNKPEFFAKLMSMKGGQ